MSTYNIYQDYSDEQLACLIKGGNQTAFTELYHRHWKPLYFDVFKKIGNKEKTEKVLVAVFADLWARRLKFPTENVGGYLFFVVRLEVLIVFANAQEQPPFERAKDNIAFYAIDAGVKISADQLSTLIDNWVIKLPEVQQAIFLLTYQDHYTTTEIAGHLQISIDKVNEALVTAYKNLREVICNYH